VAEGKEGSSDRLSVAPATSAPATSASGPRRPVFAADFPPDPELDALVGAFEAGDFARVREGAPRLVSSATDPAVKDAAKALLARTRPDPLATLLLVFSAVLLVFLSAWWMTHDRKG
jgi:hypothetical protein